MGKLKGRKPSPALLVAVVALVAALAGTAIGGVAVTSLSKKDKKQVTKIAKKQGKKQANRQIAKKAPGLSGARAPPPDSATSAESADTANGVKPVKVSFAAAADSGTEVFVDEGGIRIEGVCTASGSARVRYVNTADGGDLRELLLFENGTLVPTGNANRNAGASITNTTSVGNVIMQTTLTYRGADGTSVSGELMQAQGDGAAQCRIGGTLFVG
jgi:hypothetical protein